MRAVTCMLVQERDERSRIDFSAGTVMREKQETEVDKGESVAVLHTRHTKRAGQGLPLRACWLPLRSGRSRRKAIPLILAVVDRDGVRAYQDK